MHQSQRSLAMHFSGSSSALLVGLLAGYANSGNDSGELTPAMIAFAVAAAASSSSVSSYVVAVDVVVVVIAHMHALKGTLNLKAASDYIYVYMTINFVRQ